MLILVGVIFAYFEIYHTGQNAKQNEILELNQTYKANNTEIDLKDLTISNYVQNKFTLSQFNQTNNLYVIKAENKLQNKSLSLSVTYSATFVTKSTAMTYVHISPANYWIPKSKADDWNTFDLIPTKVYRIYNRTTEIAVVPGEMLECSEFVFKSHNMCVHKGGFDIPKGSTGNVTAIFEPLLLNPESSGMYHIRFATPYNTTIILPNNSIIVSDNSTTINVEKKLIYYGVTNVLLNDIVFKLS